MDAPLGVRTLRLLDLLPVVRELARHTNFNLRLAMSE
jgi:hypothetical protein